jgi:rubrerythrin
MKKTIENLAKAFVGESQARNRYTYYARIAQKEGYEQIAEIFLLTADQEKTHAKREFEHLQELKKKAEEKMDEIKIEAVMPTVYGTTKQNLEAAIAGETFEYTEMYPEFAEAAAKEGLNTIAKRFLAIATAEKHHRERYEKLLKELKANTVFKKKKTTWWVCRECGYMHQGKEAPKKCPSCDHPQAFYQVKNEQY